MSTNLSKKGLRKFLGQCWMRRIFQPVLFVHASAATSHWLWNCLRQNVKEKKGAWMCLFVCSLRARRMLHAVSLNKAFIWYLTQQDFEAALFNRCTDWSDLTEVPRLEITSFWSKFHQSTWLPQSRLLFHVCDLKKLLICINCPKYIHKTSIQWTGHPREAKEN